MGTSIPKTGPHLGDSDGRSARNSSAGPGRLWLYATGAMILSSFVWMMTDMMTAAVFLAVMLTSGLLFVRRIGGRSDSGTIVLVGTGSAAVALATALEVSPFPPSDLRLPVLRRTGSSLAARVIHAQSRDEAIRMLPNISCDRIVLMDVSPTAWTPPADARGLVPHTSSSVEELSQVLGRLPLQLLPVIPGFADQRASRSARVNELLKRILDLTVAIPLAILILPIIPFIALAVRLDSPGPFFYSQVRVGLGGRHFRIYKFRSMYQDAESDGAVWAGPRDHRVTRVGKALRATRLDEIPQLWNVLRGDMSLVGPRPERPELIEKIKVDLPDFELRTTVKPGLTGWAQVCAGYVRSVSESRVKLEYDLYYIMHRSIMFDLRILLRTIPVVIGRRGS